MTSLRDAIAFLTRLPVGALGASAPARRTRALLWFPLVGVFVGAVLGGTRLLFELVLPPGPSTLLALVAVIVLTGALHEDGLADTADGLGAHASPERRLEIMRDSRIGTFGGLALVSALLLAWSLLSGLEGDDCLQAAIVAHALGRWAVVPTSMLLAPARTDGVAAALRADAASLAGASVAAVVAAVACVGLVDGLAALATAIVLTAVVVRAVGRAFGGTTGDTFGATIKLVELGVLVSLVAVAPST